MRVLQVVADGKPGGGTTVVLGLVDDLLARGLDPSDIGLITECESYLYDRARARGLKVRGVNFFRSRVDPRVGLELRQGVREFRPGLVHLHGARGALQFCAMPRPWPCKVIYTVHGYHFHQKGMLPRTLAILAERHITRACDATVFVCKYDRQVSVAKGILGRSSRSTVIYNGFEPRSVGRVVRPIAKTVGILGRLTYQKDPMLALEIASLLAPDGFRFKFIGGGDMYESLKQAVQVRGLAGQVQLFGTLSHEQALDSLRDVEVLLCPSRWEGFPGAPIEAMYNGIPVVAATVGGIPEIIASWETGVLVAERDPRAYASAIRRIVSDRCLYDRVSRQGKAYVDRMFRREQSTAQYWSLYEELTCGNGKEEGGEVAMSRRAPVGR